MALTKTTSQYFPIGAAALLEYANVGQLYRMWHDHTAAGQELSSWLAVGAALWLYCAFYAICTPEQKWARLATGFSLLTNVAVVTTVVHFRYFA